MRNGRHQFFSLVATDFMSSLRKLWHAHVRINSKKSLFFYVVGFILIVSSTKYNLLGQSLDTAAADEDGEPFVVTLMRTHTNYVENHSNSRKIQSTTKICPNIMTHTHTIERISWDYFDILFLLLFSCMLFDIIPQYSGFCIYRWPSITYRTTASVPLSPSLQSSVIIAII